MIENSVVSRVKRPFAFFLAFIVTLGIFTTISTQIASADTVYGDVYMIQLPRSGDSNTSGWGQPELKLMNGWVLNETTNSNMLAIGSYNGQTVYCIEPGIGIHTGDRLVKKGEDFWANGFPGNLNKTINSEQIKTFIGRILLYGWTGNNNTSWRSTTASHATSMAQSFASQLLIWETIVGERDASFKRISTGNYDSVRNKVKSSHPLRTRIFEEYDKIVEQVQKHIVTPSFMKTSSGSANTIELTYDGSKYSAKLTDTNGVLANYAFTSSNSNVTVSKSGNTLTISTSSAPTGAVTITAKKSAKRKGVVVWSDNVYSPTNKNQVQDVLTYGEEIEDPISAFLKVEVKTGNLELEKKSNEGTVEGFQFRIKDEAGNQIGGTHVTDKNGKLSVTGIPAGKITVEEINLSNDYVKPAINPVTVTIKAGTTTQFTFENKKKRGKIKLQKSNSLPAMGDYSLAGAEFSVKDPSGKLVDTMVTDKNGTAESADLPINIEYTVKETKAPYGFVVNKDEYKVTLTGAMGSAAIVYSPTIGVPERPQTGKLTLTKTDKETGSVAQGDSSLNGAVIEIYDSTKTKVLDTLDCGSGNKATSIELPLGTYYYRESKPPTGYTHDKSFHEIKLEYAGQEISVTSSSGKVENIVIKGNLCLVKTAGDGETGIQTPETGATFRIWLKSRGSYDACLDTEKDFITIDQNGFGYSKDLPYGLYVVEQVSGWEGREMIDSFECFVSEDQKTYYYLLNNATITSLIEIRKADASSGKLIEVDGVAFQVRDKSTGELVVQHINYPTPVDIDTYYTAGGKLMMPSPLPYGKYDLIEVDVSATGEYILDPEPVPFEVTGEHTVVTVTKYNEAQKGVIVIEKQGESFTSVVELTDEQYLPVYEDRPQQGAVFTVTAETDIISKDGTKHYIKGDFVCEVTTGKDGTIRTPALPLGKYRVTEKQAPHGMTGFQQSKIVELTYAGQEVKITETKVSFYNDRQKIDLSLLKELEIDEVFEIGVNDEYLNIRFGLYAGEKITAADGTFIPEDGLIEIIGIDQDGMAVFESDLPIDHKYYVQEYAVDDHYILSTEKYAFAFSYGSQDQKTIEIITNGGEVIQNELKRGKITGIKVGEAQEPLEGAVIGLFREGCTEFIEENAILISVSDEDGYFEFLDVPYGVWICAEIEPPTGYILSSERHYVYIKNDADHIEIRIQNTLIRGHVELMKVDEDYPDHLLSGAVFEVYADINGDGVIDDDALIGELEEGRNGIYRLEDLVYGPYLLRETKAPKGFVLDETVYQFFIEEDAKTVFVETDVGENFINVAQKGKLVIQKTADDKQVSDVTFKVEGIFLTGETYCEVFKTNEKGIIEIELRAGTFTVSEVANERTERYILPPDQIVQVRHEETTNVKMHNKLKEKAPKTGDTVRFGLFAGVMAASMGVAGIIVYRKRRRDA